MDAQTGTYYIFNPETDMAMASGRECYTAPLSVRKFAANLALLPALYAPEGSIILTDYDISPDTPYIDIVRKRNLKVVRLKRGLAPAEIEPWGDWRIGLPLRKWPHISKSLRKGTYCPCSAALLSRP